jgi:hypothetical protein
MFQIDDESIERLEAELSAERSSTAFLIQQAAETKNRMYTLGKRAESGTIWKSELRNWRESVPTLSLLLWIWSGSA